jgi:hypothetical protein
MLCQWKVRTWTAVIVALIAAISASSPPEPHMPTVTIEEAGQ